MDAVEKLLRLGLKGEQEREIVRVTVDCCLQVRPVRFWWRGGMALRCGISVSLACMQAALQALFFLAAWRWPLLGWRRALAKPFGCALRCAACHPT